MLYLTRHGQTELNWAARLQGWTDSPLTERGQQQAHSVGVKLRSILGSTRVVLYASPLGRAQETASIMRTYLQVSAFKTDHRLKEIGIGDWEGMTMEDIEFTHPGALDGVGRYEWPYHAPGGEPKTTFLGRLNSWLQEIEATNLPTVAVSHGWAGMALRAEYTGKNMLDVTATGDSHEAVFELSSGGVREY